MSHLDRELSQLESIRRKLAADIVDKAAAIDVDTKVLDMNHPLLHGVDRHLVRTAHDLPWHDLPYHGMTYHSTT